MELEQWVAAAVGFVVGSLLTLAVRHVRRKRRVPPNYLKRIS